jgi:serine/threonine protein kinase
MLTGHPVFSADTPVATVIAHVQNAPDPPSRRSEFRIPPALDALIMECLAKDPAARPASAAIVSGRLAAAVSQEAWTDERARRWWDRHDTSSPKTGHDRAPSSAEAETSFFGKAASSEA